MTKKFEKVIGVDIDKELLQRKQILCRPLTYDFIDKRELPFHIAVYHGSVTDYDSRLEGCDAISMIEL